MKFGPAAAVRIITTCLAAIASLGAVTAADRIAIYIVDEIWLLDLQSQARAAIVTHRAGD